MPIDPRPRSARRAILPLFVLAASAAAQVPTPAFPHFVPWFYTESDGRSVWDRHRFYEDNANTVFALSRDLVTLPVASQQTGVYHEVLLCNYAQFSPPEGYPAPASGRRLLKDSIERKGLQLWVNYSESRIVPSVPGKFKSATFFLSLDTPLNTQTEPPVAALGFSPHTVSATHAAFGVVSNTPGPLQGMVFPVGQVPASGTTTTPMVDNPNAVYVTASIGYAKSDIDPADHTLVDSAWQDRLLVRDPNGYWADESYRVPDVAKLGNSSGVAFADFNNDGRMDLYVGKPGDNYNGAPNVLLIYNRISGLYEDKTSWIAGGEPAKATVDVVAADLDRDGDLDIVVANRMKRGGPAGPEAEDYYLINDGTGHFTVHMLAPGVFSDSRSVAAGDLDNPLGGPGDALEIVFGNAGSEGDSNALSIPVADDHPMQIFSSPVTFPALAYTDQTIPTFIPSTQEERAWTSPLTYQVVLADLLSPGGSPPAQRFVPDGYLDLMVVNQREILKNDPTLISVNNVRMLSNRGATAGTRLAHNQAFPTFWGKTIALGNLLKGPYPSGSTPEYLDLFVGNGNRFSGVQPDVLWNGGATVTDPQSGPWLGFDKTYDRLPGTEHGYGLDIADYNGNGILDALQTARSYNYLVDDLFTGGAHLNPHKDFTLVTSPQQTNNLRGRMNPKGMEDGVFADFDGDGDMDAILVSDRTSSDSTPSGFAMAQKASADTIVLENVGGPSQFQHAVTAVPLVGAPVPENVFVDNKILINGRTQWPFPGIADRVVAGDLDNDGDTDAIVHLFGVKILTGPTDPLPLLTGANGFTAPLANYSAGWRYLQNIISDAGTPAGTWFRDVAATKMVDPAGAFSTTWNRGLGMDVLADFDNNGKLDLYTTFGLGVQALNLHPGGVTENDVEHIAQTYDLLFMNGTGTDAAGILREQSVTLLPVPAVDVVGHPVTGGTATWDNASSFFVAQGDIDNDGYADVFVNHAAATGRTNYPSLLINRLGDPNPANRKFLDQFVTRVPINALSPTIHTVPVPGFPGMDLTQTATFIDYDGDGDLDIVYQVDSDFPRVLKNKGQDLNGDGLINAADGSLLGQFEDATDAALWQLKPTPSPNDMMTVDLDGDGDLDFVVDPFNDAVTFWRNDGPIGTRPRVTEAWPRVGSLRGKTITLHGVNFTGATIVRLHFAGGTQDVTPTVLSDQRLQITLPSSGPRGLAQVRVQRTVGTTTEWTTQYFGYFVQR